MKSCKLMVMASDYCSKVRQLISELDAAVEMECVHGRCEHVKNLLEGLFRSKEELLPAEFLQPAPDKYARRLLHRDPAGRYSVVAMVWDVGQGTALHDHAGEWCVECVYRGKIEVVSYDLIGDESAPLMDFRHEKTIFAGQGEAGALIPPFEYHTIANALTDQPSVTIHVYGHELHWCNIFVPTVGGYERVRRELSYTA
jgi:3-mercaptopropionate dioxygenase